MKLYFLLLICACGLYAQPAPPNIPGGSGLPSGCTSTTGQIHCNNGFTSGTGSTAGVINLYDSGGVNYTGFTAPSSLVTPYVLAFPSAAPTSGQSLTFAAPSGGISTGSWSSGGGVTPSIITTYNAAPSCTSGIAGQLFLIPTGAGIFGQCDGSTTHWMYNHFAVTPPGPKSGWTVEQSDTSVANPDGSIMISATNTAAYNALVKTVSSKTSWTIGVTNQFFVNTTGEAECLAIAGDAAAIWGFGDHTYVGGAAFYQETVNTIASDYSSRSTAPYGNSTDPVSNNGLKWFRIYLSGGNIHFARSSDGLNFIDIPSAAQSDSSTSFTSVGFGCSTISAGGNAAQMTVFSVN